MVVQAAVGRVAAGMATRRAGKDAAQEALRRRGEEERVRNLARAERDVRNSTQKEQGRGDQDTRGKGEEEPKPIGFITIILLLSVALFLDGIQGTVGLMANLTGILMPLGIGLNFFITIFAQCLFFIWFLLLGRLMVKDLRGGVSRFCIFATELIVEILPVVNAVPAITSAVSAFIIMSVLEDRERKRAGKLAVLGVGLLERAGAGRRQSATSQVLRANLASLQDGSAGVQSQYQDEKEQERGVPSQRPQEYELDLRALAKNQARAFVRPREELHKEIGGYDYYGVVDSNNREVPRARVRLAWLVGEESARSRGFTHVEPLRGNGTSTKYRFVRESQVRPPAPPSLGDEEGS